MDIVLKKREVMKIETDALAVLWTSEGGKLAMAAMLDKALDGWLTKTAAEEGFTGKEGETLTVRTEGKLPAKRVILCGVGAKKNLTEESVRGAAASAVGAMKKQVVSKLAFVLDSIPSVGMAEVAKAAAEGVELAAYRFGAFKTLDNEGPASVEIIVEDAKSLKAAHEGFALGRLGAAATMKARDLVNSPANHLSPLALAQATEEIVKDKAHVAIKIIRKPELETMGMGGLLGVGQGSDHEPVLVHLTYTPTKKSKKKLAIVGKAVTFDSGGLSLKPSNSMETMKCDMSGAAAVIGLFSAIDKLKPNAEVHGIFGACENMPSGKALRPGDVVKTMSGKTIEILNTDAEGRVTLADTLHYATTLEPDAIVELSTLTGACLVALGEEITGLMSNHRPLAEKIKNAAEEAGESVWELPLEKRYKKELKSDVADYKNTTSRWGGTLTAGLLLEEFVAGKPFVHLDIAGPAFAEKPMNAYTPKGGTGHGVRTLMAWLRGY